LSILRAACLDLSVAEPGQVFLSVSLRARASHSAASTLRLDSIEGERRTHSMTSWTRWRSTAEVEAEMCCQRLSTVSRETRSSCVTGAPAGSRTGTSAAPESKGAGKRDAPVLLPSSCSTALTRLVGAFLSPSGTRSTPLPFCFFLTGISSSSSSLPSSSSLTRALLAGLSGERESSRAVLRRRFLGSVEVEAEAGRVRGTMGSRRTTGLLARLGAAGPLKVRVCGGGVG